MTDVPAAYRAAILAVRPDLAAAPMVAHTAGWDSLGVEAGDYLFKFPKTPIAESRLRREVKYLDLIRPRVPLRIPELRIHDQPLTFSEHRMIPGRILVTKEYDVLSELQRELMAAELGRFYAALHAIPVAEAKAAGAIQIPDWPDDDMIIRHAAPVIPPDLHGWMLKVLAAYAGMRHDTDLVTGYFDGHGWNMAFDHVHGVLNGVYDFADGGVGPRQREFCYGNLISPDLTTRTIAHYEAITGRTIDRRTVMLHTAVQKLSEAQDFGDDASGYVANLVAWHDVMARDPELAL